MSIAKSLRLKTALPALIVGLAGVLMVLFAWQLPPFQSAVQSTNNAYVKGQVTVLSPQIPGYVTEVAVQDYMMVRKGDLIARIDDRIYRQQLAQAEAALAQQQSALASFDQNRLARQASLDLAKAQLQSAEAALQKAQHDQERTGSLVSRGISSAAIGDQVRVALMQAEAGVAQGRANVELAEQNLALVDAGKPSLAAGVKSAEAAVALAEINLGNTRVTAPVDGRLGEVGVRVGQYVTAGSQLSSVTPSTVWVIANFKEAQLANLRVGLPATFTVDALDHATLHGHVIRISPATGSEFSVLKPDNATGNFTKVAQRIPVRIELDGNQDLADQLRPGMSVVVAVNTGAAVAAALAAADRGAGSSAVN
ncbi:HlyD family secretion protein [Phreatobacter stygius]|uniref:HlyD family secretion protein n=1 Tax=Phreatobacter stygius TaxID=1940610 RepID=A0A4D7B5U0_9HYPH|nr:HlyD family secretion protein [Phreatobacter stygius]QCI66353.1 HlyD family secretion protein [Phreatobacter stygius]